MGKKKRTKCPDCSCNVEAKDLKWIQNECRKKEGCGLTKMQFTEEEIEAATKLNVTLMELRRAREQARTIVPNTRIEAGKPRIKEVKCVNPQCCKRFAPVKDIIRKERAECVLADMCGLTTVNLNHLSETPLLVLSSSEPCRTGCDVKQIPAILKPVVANDEYIEIPISKPLLMYMKPLKHANKK